MTMQGFKKRTRKTLSNVNISKRIRSIFGSAQVRFRVSTHAWWFNRRRKRRRLRWRLSSWVVLRSIRWRWSLELIFTVDLLDEHKHSRQAVVFVKIRLNRHSKWRLLKECIIGFTDKLMRLSRLEDVCHDSGWRWWRRCGRLLRFGESNVVMKVWNGMQYFPWRFFMTHSSSLYPRFVFVVFFDGFYILIGKLGGRPLVIDEAQKIGNVVTPVTPPLFNHSLFHSLKFFIRGPSLRQCQWRQDHFPVGFLSSCQQDVILHARSVWWCIQKESHHQVWPFSSCAKCVSVALVRSLSLPYSSRKTGRTTTTNPIRSNRKKKLGSVHEFLVFFRFVDCAEGRKYRTVTKF